MKTLAPIPKEGEIYWFYPNDIVKENNQYEAKIQKVYPFSATAWKFIYTYDDYLEDLVSTPVMDIWMEELKEMFWILASETDYIIEISVPELCQQRIFVARDQDGGWHSFVTIMEKEFGILDTSNSIIVGETTKTDVDNSDIDDMPIGGEYYW